MTPLTPPLSKSDAQRALILGDILGLSVDLGVDELPNDVKVLQAGLAALKNAEATVDCHDGGAPFRFLLAQAAVLPNHRTQFTGTPRLGERPHAPLVAALRAALPGLQLDEGNPWPITVSAPPKIERAYFEVDAQLSSQFASAVLLAAARLVTNGSSARVTVSANMTSEGYFQLTRSWLERAGFTLDADGTLRAPARRPAQLPPIPGDWSSLGYLLALSWVSGLSVDRAQRNSGHPDEAVVSILGSAGLRFDGSRVTGSPTRGFEDVDCARCPDAIPTLAVWATRLPAASRFTNTQILKLKESDRLSATLALLHAANAKAEVQGDTLVVHPSAVSSGFDFDARDDHRMAMSAAVLARLFGQRVRLRGMNSVAKSFPNFWREAAKAGVLVEEAQ
ncbi:MAG: 3-phosphoshikimate 1-carboxyvinyltransferase [Archangium sp.]